MGLVLLGIAAIHASETIDPDNDGSQYAWAENIGWLNAEPGRNGGPGMSITPDTVEGWLWAENVGWISLACANTSSCAAAEYRVTNDGGGNLSGYGWAENIGWISFSCENTGSCSSTDYGVVVDTMTGDLSGRAWSENSGWVSLSCSNTASCSTVDYGVTTDPTPLEEIFSEGMESGEISGWSSSVP
jgi:hypothetical protein